MNSMNNSTDQGGHAMPAMPGDNRTDEVRYLNDVADLTRMASILEAMIDKCLAWSRAIKHDRERTVLTFQFSEDSIDNLLFAARDIHDRARALEARSDHLFEQEAGQ